jgi:2-polyprenyl-3-methyl-5-hydroxy-6-metoxy-1,4-benzoquinol methylase
MTKDLNRKWESVDKGHRHFIDNMSSEKIKNLLRRFESNLLDHVTDGTKVLDWGCGGGLIANRLKENYSVTIADISSGSLEECSKHTGIDDTLLIPNNLKDLSLDKRFDIVHCSDVVHHFPSLDYWKSVVNIWKKITNKYVLMNAKIGKLYEANNYFDGKNYITGIVMPKEYVISHFKEFKLINYEEEKAVFSKARFGFFVFEKEE